MPATEILYAIPDNIAMDNEVTLAVEDQQNMVPAADGLTALFDGQGSAGFLFDIGAQSLPAGSVITGFEFAVVQRGSGGPASISACVVSNGKQSDTRTVSGLVNTSDVTTLVGGPSDAFGNNINAGDIAQNLSFHMLFTLGSGASPFRVDSVGMKIYYATDGTGIPSPKPGVRKIGINIGITLC